MDCSADFKITIGGGDAATSTTLDVINPATGQAFALAPVADAGILDCAVNAAKGALSAWRLTPIEERRRLLLALADEIENHADGLSALFTSEQGRPLPLARREIISGANWMRAVAKQDLPVEVVEDGATRRVEVHREPIGVVAAVVPWNFPFLLAIWKIAPALLAGNTVVLKPSPYTPLCALKLGELSRGVLPDGVLNVISGADALGPMITAHPGFAKISFTGSTATGRRVMEAAARDLKRLTLELGGNDAAIVFADVDVDKVSEQIFNSAFFNSGQVCVATKRLYIHSTIYEAFREKLSALVRAAVVGDGREPGVSFGPVQNVVQFGRVKAFIDEARRQGLTLLQGAPGPETGGYFIPLTLVDDPPEESHVVKEEAFGPILPLLRFDDVDDVIARVNDSQYGLAGSVWSADVEFAVQIALRIESGSIWINQDRQLSPHIPFAGVKQSGFGVENGREGLLEFTHPKAIYIPKANAKS